LASCSRNSSKVVHEADSLMHQAFQEYGNGSFGSASNALQTYVAYLDANEQRIAGYRDYDAKDLNGNDVPFPVSRDLPVMQLVPHSMLVCMMVYAGNTNEAVSHLSRAYDYHTRIWTRTKRSPVPRAEFLQFILDGRDKIDSKAGAAWKAQIVLHTNVVSGISAAWMRQQLPETR